MSSARPARLGRGVPAEDGPGAEVIAAESLNGDPVINAKGEELGRISDVMLDMRRGCVAYAVLASGGFLGIGDKLFAVPWSALMLDADRKCFILDIDRRRLESAPAFDKESWPSMADSRWATKVHSYFGVRPYWQAAALQ